jgi:membrane associated rhomboid family serine protease
MFLPLYDGVPLRYLRRPVANYTLIAANILVFLATSAGLLGNPDRLDLALGVIPSVLFDHAVLAKGLALVPAPLTLLTGIFLHGGLGHLAGNMIFLWVFGDNVEDAMGSARYFGFYLTCGIVSGLFYALMVPMSQAPLIGASGAIAGVVAAYLILYPRVRVFGLALQILPLRISAIWCLGIWIVFQIYSALTSSAGSVGWWAHVGGLACGGLLTPFIKRRNVRLFGDRPA